MSNDDDLSKRRVERANLKAKYQDGLDSILDPVTASWQARWVEDCKKKGSTISFGKWCLIPLVEGDPMSTPFEIANVYTEETFREC